MQEGLYQAGEQGLYQEQEGPYGGQEYRGQFNFPPDRSGSALEGEEASYGPDYPQGMAPLPGSLGLGPRPDPRPRASPGDPRAPRASFDDEEEVEPAPAGPRPGAGGQGPGLAQSNAGLFLLFMISYFLISYFFSSDFFLLISFHHL